SVAPSNLDSHVLHKEAEGTSRSVRKFCRSKRTNSCPPKASRSVISGPWSLEWLHDQTHGEAGVIFSSSGKAKKGDKLDARQQKVSQSDPRKRKGGGLLRHPLHSIKKVARLPSKDRGEVLKILKKHVRRRRGGDSINRSCSVSRRASSDESSSSSSVNNDWQNWVAMQGSEQMAVDDVWGIGKAIGVKFKGDNVNMFRVLSRANKGKKEHPGPHHEGGVRQDSRLRWVREKEGGASTLWGSLPHEFSFRPSAGASGGLLTIWDPSEVVMWSTESRDHVLWCHGRFLKTGEDFSVPNVYAPCDDIAKQPLWDYLSMRIQVVGMERVCICGDFNAVKHVDERRSSSRRSGA
ncbi:putative sulfate transporter, partial [Trifolium pratense]